MRETTAPVMICTRCNRPSNDAERCAKCGTRLKTFESQKSRGWLALGAALFLALFMGAIWIWIDRLFAANGVSDPAALTYLGRINVAFALVVVSGILGTINGWMMAHSGRRNTPLIVALLACFIAALFIAGSASSSYHPAAAAELPSLSSPSVQSSITAAIERDRKRYGGRTPIPATIVGVWDAGGHGYVRTFGYSDLANQVPVTTADHFRIGSNTKTFVVAVLLQLVGEKKLSLDDPLSRFDLGIAVPNAEHITVRELCNMRSGLYEAYDTPQFAKLNWKVPPGFNPRLLVGWAVRQKPYFAPNQGYRYSNTNYLLLGMIVESITKDGIGDEIRKRLIVPYGLTQTSFPDSEAMPAPWTRGYELDTNRNWRNVSNTVPVAFMWSAGAMISDMNDIRRWIKLFTTGEAGGRATYGDLVDCIPFLGNTSFGLGITCSAGWYGYTGALPGYNTGDYYSPSTGLTILVWINYQAPQPIEGVASVMVRDIARIVTPNRVPFVYTQSDLRTLLH